MQIGDTLPKFNLPTIPGQTLSSEDLSGNWSVVYFYPKDNTPGCTKEALAFSEHIEEFEKLGVKVIGVSKDSPKKHENFIQKHNLKIDLVSDEDGNLCESFGVWAEKKMYGKVYWGIIRSTFLFDPDQKLYQAWQKVKVPGHAETVLQAVSEAINSRK
ncbi:MAG: thioredoxin-dependent thiol peroxidase [Ponticaulis sp.]|nr:thioredoxin-dependent thiol peroxidase [Ponticaulis sp.]|tara:strand:- start:24913 stop:25386 length:474 start_codon:yes stop_codon:yes gene_type:complete